MAPADEPVVTLRELRRTPQAGGSATGRTLVPASSVPLGPGAPPRRAQLTDCVFFLSKHKSGHVVLFRAWQAGADGLYRNQNGAAAIAAGQAYGL